MDSHIFPNDRCGLIFDRRTRYFLGIEDNALMASLIIRMRQVGAETVESREFHPEPTEASRFIEECLGSGLSTKETNRSLKQLKDPELVGVSRLSREEIDRRMGEWERIKATFPAPADGKSSQT